MQLECRGGLPASLKALFLVEGPSGRSGHQDRDSGWPGPQPVVPVTWAPGPGVLGRVGGRPCAQLECPQSPQPPLWPRPCLPLPGRLCCPGSSPLEELPLPGADGDSIATSWSRGGCVPAAFGAARFGACEHFCASHSALSWLPRLGLSLVCRACMCRGRCVLVHVVSVCPGKPTWVQGACMLYVPVCVMFLACGAGVPKRPVCCVHQTGLACLRGPRTRLLVCLCVCPCVCMSLGV